jgi:hypothetical protein
MTAIDAKPSKQRFDRHPRLARVARKKPTPVTLGDDAASVMLFYGLSERAYRERLFADFCRFCRLHGGWVVSPSHQGRAHVQIAEGSASALLEKLAQWPRYPVVKLPGVSHRLTHGRFISVTEIQVTLWR